MIFEKISAKRLTLQADGFGGNSTKAAVDFTIFGKTNITDNELKALPQGYGFYKKIVIVTIDELLTDDRVIIENTSFRIVSSSKSKTLNIYYGVQDD